MKTKSTDKEAHTPDGIARMEIDAIKGYLWLSVSGAIIIGVVMIGLMSIYSYNTMEAGMRSFGSGVLIAGGSVLSGGFLGFIFGIPSILQNPDASLKYNDNLVQISDWLTKIIVGVGLTQLYSIPHFIIRLGEHFRVNFGEAEWGRNVAIAIIGYFVVLGFLMIYFWTKTDYSTVMKVMDDDLNKKLKKAEKELSNERKEKEQTEQKLEEAHKTNEMKSEDINAVIQTFSPTAELVKEKIDAIKNNPDMPNDPEKGKWGGKAESNGRKVSANVRPTSYDKEWFNINLEVTATDTGKPLTGDVVFHLHPSFPEPVMKVQAAGNTAQLQLVAWGAFTVGVECDGGQTRLEIDLAELPDAPAIFRER